MLKHIITAFLLIASLGSAAQRSIVFTRLGIPEGLNTDKIKNVTQDRKGFIWIGHENGMQRYDGMKFINFYNKYPREQMAPAAVDEVTTAGDQKLWVRQGTRIGLLDISDFKFSAVSADNLQGSQRKAIFSFFLNRKKEAYLLSRSLGILKYDSVEKKFSTKNSDIHAPQSWPVNSVAENVKSGEYWIGGDSGISLYHKKTNQIYYAKNNPHHLKIFSIPGVELIRHVTIDKFNTIWIAYWRLRPIEKGLSIMRFDPQQNKVLLDTTLSDISGNRYKDIYEITSTASGNLWFSGINTLLQYDQSTHSFIEYLKPNPGEFEIHARVINDVFEDREQNLWISSDNGLYITGPERRGVYNIVFSPKPGSDVLVESILETANKENWIGTWEHGINFFDKNFIRINTPTPLTGKPNIDRFLRKVWSMHQHRVSNDIWVACHAAYIMILDANTRKIKTLISPAVFRDETINRIVEDAAGNLWFTTLNGQLIFWKFQKEIKPESFIPVQQFNSGILNIIIDTKHRLWIATNLNGLFVLDETGTKTLMHFTSDGNNNQILNDNKVLDVVQINDSIFLAAAGGLNIINTNTKNITSKTLYDGLPGASVYQLCVDDKGMVWMISNNGLSSYQLQKDLITVYNRKDGVINANNARFCKFTMANGEIWFGGENALLGFDPAALKFISKPPKVLITDFRLFNTFLPADSLLALQRITLNNDQNSFSVYFSALNFSQQEKLTYYFMLEGSDNEWQQAERVMSTYFTALPPGKYTFKVKCENMQGESSAITALNIYIKPPFYRTWWFIVLCFGLVTAIIYWLYMQRISKLLALEKLRSKVARDLHDDMGSTLSTINILSSMAKTRMNSNSIQASEYISKISENSQRMMEAMDDIVWSIKPDNDSMQKITGRMREFATSVLEAKDIDIDFRVDENVKNIKLNMEARRDFFLIFKEAINNIAKYARCTHAEVHIASHKQRLVFSIKDNGVGFNVATADTGNGLGNMSKRAEALKGRLQIHSSPGKGTRINLNIPLQ